MGRAGAALLVVALAARAAAAAESDFPRVVGKAGVYVVSSCGIVGYGASEREARVAFKRAVSAARPNWRSMDKRCAMLNRADVVRITPDMRPAFFWVGGRTGTDRQELVRRCRAEEEAALKARPDVGGPDPASCDHAAGAYGPFTRKPVWDGFDDARSFVYLDEHGWWLSEEGQPICFPAGTPVATLDGDRPIETLAAGDLVLSWSMDRGAPVEARVIHVKRRQARELLELTLDDGRALRVSANHPLYVPARADWVPAGDLRAGDRLAMLADGRLVPVAIAVIAARHIDVDVFDLTIETTHAYFAGGVLAHNY